MNETIFGSGTPVWTAMPSIGLAYQPMNVSNRPIAPPLFSSTAIPGGIGGALTGAGLSAQQSPAGSGYVAPYPFASPASALPGHDTNGWVTATSLLTAVAQRRGQPQGPVNDHEVEDFIYDALDLLPGTTDVEVRSENGRVTLTGVVQHKRTKRDVGEIAWALPGLQDVQNNVSITSRRRGRAGREEPPAASARKQG
jgi:hypothetical protein